jgi:hypothetical protein
VLAYIVLYIVAVALSLPGAVGTAAAVMGVLIDAFAGTDLDGVIPAQRVAYDACLGAK